ncbi:GGDEF domain-containing protein [Fusibacter sp. 3D3]|uniref:GGDEF domain-containing protein n=1 Tax=Fusibacter sp. 3D3 TaxID=1048380 RepID=UPI000852FADC|nr:GGDEF domain-containing protein [Fusibacter sp. 3D3]GAU77977.1 diguanylate cyclase/phosphodiesterase [Fusibacter sp. 3D3]
MNKFYRPFMFTIVIFAIGFFVDALKQPVDWSAFDMSFVLIVLVCVISETNYRFSQSSIKHSLTAPLTLFLIFYKPLLLCYFGVLIFETIGKVVSVKREGGSNHILDEKWLFNVAQFILLIALSKYYIAQLTILPTVEFITHLMILVFAYNLINTLLTHLVISLHNNTNHFKRGIIRNFIAYSFSYFIIVMALIFTYEAYNLFGLIVISIFVLQTQGSALTSLTAKELNQRLSVDKMTNAFNRNFFDEVVELNLIRKKPFSILFIDLDDFKLVNDAYGHVIGDALLIDFVAIIKSLLRRENRVFRYGGDEFCIIFDNMEQAESVRKRLEAFVFMFQDEKSETMIYYHISLGLYDYTADSDITYNELIHQVDQNMYDDKRRKKEKEKTETVFELL